jgi:hypothetical protein
MLSVVSLILDVPPFTFLTTSLLYLFFDYYERLRTFA